ncbi:hypothetical protein KUV50_10335 [Membranicola marinus]|uniref:Lipoprotein n=1 Tax=Membranihabitans marinus TaxID=1227546 RepID=A0A953HXN0_9BACT|nr:hypothetical protein [Membranihabitans marinus]MBY5958531.1 hypothetical protein [Membranihabitans marinus]
MKYLILGIALLTWVSCSKEGVELKANDFLIFGRFYGECRGKDCVKMFKLTSDQLLEDTADSYLATEFDFVPLSNDKYQQVKDLMNAIPGQLLNEEEDTIGCPDCADQGGLYIEFSDNGKTNSWRIDQNKSAVPVYLHDFIDEVNKAINQL